MFSVILDPFQGSFFREIRISTTSHSEYKISKRKNKCYQKAKNIIFRSAGPADWFVEFKKYLKLAPKPF